MFWILLILMMITGGALATPVTQYDYDTLGVFELNTSNIYSHDIVASHIGSVDMMVLSGEVVLMNSLRVEPDYISDEGVNKIIAPARMRASYMYVNWATLHENCTIELPGKYYNSNSYVNQEVEILLAESPGDYWVRVIGNSTDGHKINGITGFASNQTYSAIKLRMTLNNEWIVVDKEGDWEPIP